MVRFIKSKQYPSYLDQNHDEISALLEFLSDKNIKTMEETLLGIGILFLIILNSVFTVYFIARRQ